MQLDRARAVAQTVEFARGLRAQSVSAEGALVGNAVRTAREASWQAFVDSASEDRPDCYQLRVGIES